MLFLPVIGCAWDLDGLGGWGWVSPMGREGRVAPVWRVGEGVHFAAIRAGKSLQALPCWAIETFPGAFVERIGDVHNSISDSEEQISKHLNIYLIT